MSNQTLNRWLLFLPVACLAGLFGYVFGGVLVGVIDLNYFKMYSHELGPLYSAFASLFVFMCGGAMAPSRTWKVKLALLVVAIVFGLMSLGEPSNFFLSGAGIIFGSGVGNLLIPFPAAFIRYQNRINRLNKSRRAICKQQRANGASMRSIICLYISLFFRPSLIPRYKDTQND